ncbi:glycosyltransferase [Roseomonas terrae]|uniref:Glycosyltransferase n=1 Tax=Neoroseomonas terrae TaxID=424799 RepID=A0ABS5EHZ9_9PROT|nr:glycosyltransferase [Neoroseomonas terrae]MBR0650658.1 glycosyltransferase [Neoroseomonas terrae]
MRIAQIMAGAPHGGAEAFYERLCIGLHAAGEQVLPVIRRDAERSAKLRAGGLAPVELGFGGALDLLTGPRLRGALTGFAPAVAIAWMNRAARFTPKGAWTLVGRLGGYYDLKYYRRCDHLVGNTRDIVRWIAAQGWAPARTHYLPNFAADLAGAAPADLPGRTRLLAMGRLHRNKGFDIALRALAALPAAHLSIAGEGPERAALESLAAELGVMDRVTFLGWRSDIGALLAGCDIFVCSSRHEPLGNIVLEAWSASRPVVAAAAQGPTELITDDDTGLLVPVEDADALACAIGALIADPQRAARLAQAGRAAYEGDFTEAAVVARWRDFLAAVAPRQQAA